MLAGEDWGRKKQRESATMKTKFESFACAVVLTMASAVHAQNMPGGATGELVNL